MGTNLSQVFVANTDALQVGNVFNVATTANRMGIWNLAGNSGAGAYVNSALYAVSVDITDEVGGAAASTNEVTDVITAVANPVWLFNRLQFVQGTAGNPIATPIINTANIKRIKYDPYTAFVGTKATIADATLNVSGAANNDEYNFKFIIRSTPTDYLNFYDQNAANLFTKEFPLGTFNTTNHKAINVTVKIADVADADNATNVTRIQDALAAHPLLGNMFTAADASGSAVDITARHPGVVFDLLISNVTKGKDAVACAITGQVLGVGNPWQVLGDEIKCRSRYGNFNRMYLPQNMPTFTNTTYKYDKITIEYEHNWPTSTGIAPAGTLNQVVLYHSDSDGSAPETDAGGGGTTATVNTFDNAFVYTLGTAKEFLW